MIVKNRVLTPGPTPILPQAQFAQACAVMHHRTPEFETMFRKAQEGFKALYRTKNDVLMFAASGSGAMEASVANSLDAGDKAIFVNGGKFGERWAEIGRAYGVDVIEITLEWGESIDVNRLADVVKQHQGAVRAVFIQGCETSTGALNDIANVSKLVHAQDDCLLIVDGITYIGAQDVSVDELGIDLCVCGSQKSLSMPPGLATVSISPRAWTRAEKVKLPRYYFNFLNEREPQSSATTFCTPAISLVAAAQASLEWIASLDDGVRSLARNAQVLSACTRAAAEALGLKVFPKHPANAVTPILMPQGVSSKVVIGALKKRFGAVIADGQDAYKGKLFRLAHLGYVDYVDTVGVIAAIEQVLYGHGSLKEFGAGVTAAQKTFQALSSKAGVE